MPNFVQPSLRLRDHRPLPFVAVLLAGFLSVPTGLAALEAEEGYSLVRQLAAESRKERRAASEALVAAGEPAWVAPIVDHLFYVPRERRRESFKALEALTGEDRGQRYFDWVELVGERESVSPPEGYMAFKLSLLQNIDKRYAAIFYKGAPAKIRLEEVVWGGVKLDGIPTLQQPAHVPASEASFMAAKERVFGVSVGGEHRAYPVRVLSWHELLNDTVGGEPIALSYCTLCGSGIAYGTRSAGGSPYTFGTSGLLYRSNKLMFDHETFSLWSNITGEPVVGRSALTSFKLSMVPSTLTTWEEWRKRHPETTVMAIDRQVEKQWGFDYRRGAADNARRGVSFPVWLKNDSLDPKAEVYAIRVGEAAKAYPLERLGRSGVVNDAVGELALVLVSDESSGAVRAYERGELRFRAGADENHLEDSAGGVWQITEEALISTEGETVTELARVPGHVAFWFGWYGFYPQTELYTVSSSS